MYHGVLFAARALVHIQMSARGSYVREDARARDVAGHMSGFFGARWKDNARTVH